MPPGHRFSHRAQDHHLNQDPQILHCIIQMKSPGPSSQSVFPQPRPRENRSPPRGRRRETGRLDKGCSLSAYSLSPTEPSPECYPLLATSVPLYLWIRWNTLLHLQLGLEPRWPGPRAHDLNHSVVTGEGHPNRGMACAKHGITKEGAAIPGQVFGFQRH